jgi:hypothetical protein
MAHFVYPVPANAQPPTAYPPQPAYVAAAPAQAAYGTATPRAGQAYESYPAAHATTQYAYTTRTQVAVTVSFLPLTAFLVSPHVISL